MKAYYYLLILVLIGIGCESDREETVVEPAGTIYSVSDKSMEEVHQSLVQFLKENEGLKLMNDINFQKTSETEDVDIEIDRVRTIFFGNPKMGTPLIQQNPLVALDLPQHLVLFEHKDKVFAMYNSVDYLQSRYRLQGAPGLNEISAALENLVGTATGSPLRGAEEQGVAENEGIVTVASQMDFKQTFTNLRRALSQNESWRITSEIDHAENAAGAGIQLRPIRLFMISNPYLESAMLKDNPTTALDYPNKILIWEDTEGIVRISYNDPNYLQKRHQMIGTSIELAETSTAFKAIVDYAATQMDYDAPENTEMQFDDN